MRVAGRWAQTSPGLLANGETLYWCFAPQEVTQGRCLAARHGLVRHSWAPSNFGSRTVTTYTADRTGNDQDAPLFCETAGERRQQPAVRQVWYAGRGLARQHGVRESKVMDPPHLGH